MGGHKRDENATLPSMADLNVNTADTEQFFVHIENLSRSIYILEQMKFSLREENVHSVMELLDDDKYLTVNELQLEQKLNYRA